jgi:DNA-binding cell septation regulator SpoVG
VYVKVNNEEEVRRLNEFKTNLLLAIDLNSKMWHQTNDTNYKSILHYVNEKNRQKVKDCDAQLKKYM